MKYSRQHQIFGSRLFTLAKAAAALAFVASLALNTTKAQIPFETFDDGDVSDIEVFSGSGVGIGVGTTDGQDGTLNTGLAIGINPPETGGFAGFVVPGGAGSTDVSAMRSLTFFLRATTVQAGNLPLTLEINFHEDVNGNGTYEGGAEDEYQATYPLEPGTGYQLVQIPLSLFADDNATFPGANDGFDYGALLEIVVAIGGPQGPEFAFAMDDLIFSDEGPGPFLEFDFFNDGNVGDIFVYSDNNGGGIAVSPVDDANGTPARAINVGIDPSGTGAFAGFGITGGPGVTDLGNADYLAFQIRPLVVAGNLPITLEINLHEDVDGNGAYDGNTEDEYQALYSIAGQSGYIDVVFPLEMFSDDNADFPGADDGFDFAKLLEIVINIDGPTGPVYALSFDQFGYSEANPTAGQSLPEGHVEFLAVYPNPFAGQTQIAYRLEAAGPVLIELFDMLGRRISTVLDTTRPSGENSVALNAGRLASGTYVVLLSTSGGKSERRLVTVTR